MTQLEPTPTTSRFSLAGDRTKGMKLLGIMIVGLTLRDHVAPAGSHVARSCYGGVVVAGMLFVLCRPGMPRLRAIVWAVLGGLAAAAAIAW